MKKMIVMLDYYFLGIGMVMNKVVILIVYVFVFVFEFCIERGFLFPDWEV